MSHRLPLEDYEVSVHLDEVGYLTDLSMAIKVLFHDIKDASEYTPQLDFVMLARWQVEYLPNILRCGRYHHEDAGQITEIVQKLMDGLKADNPMRDITQADINMISEVRKRLEGCREKVIWR